MSKKEIAHRIHLCGMKPDYWIKCDVPFVDTFGIWVSAMRAGNAIVRALRQAVYELEKK